MHLGIEGFTWSDLSDISRLEDLARAFDADGHDVVVLSRRAGDTPWRTVLWAV